MFSRKRRQGDFAEEIESHIALEAERLRREGLSAKDAESAARIRFGNVMQAEERFYESQRVLWFEDLQKDLRYAIRMARQWPMFAATVIVTLALGIGATAAIFSVADAALIKPLPLPDAQRLVSLYERWQGDLDSLAPADYLDYRREAKSFEDLAAYRHDSFNLGGENRPERVLGAIVTPNFFSVLQVRAKLGRTLNQAVDKPGGSRTVVISESLWKRRYGGAGDVIGKTVTMDGEPRVIVGVMPADFAFPENTEMWAAARYQVPEHPLRPLIDQSATRTTHYFDIIGRLKPDVPIREAQAEVDVIGRRLAQQYKDEEARDGAAVLSLRDDLMGNTRPAIFVLLGAVAVLFLVACANVANIVLARGAARQKEIAIRGSLGANRLRLVRQLLVESFLLSLAGAALGLIGARYVLRSLQTLLPADVLPAGGLHIDSRLVAFAIGVSVLSTILFGLWPAIEAVKLDLNGLLKDSGRIFSGGTQASRSRKILVAMQIALAFVLLTGAGLLIRSFDRLLSSPSGFSPDHVLSLQLSLPVAQYPAPADRNRFEMDVLEKLRAIPGVRAAAASSWLPMTSRSSQRSIAIKDRPTVEGEDISPFYAVTSPDYFRTLRIPVLSGRTFTKRDTANAPPVFIVSATTAKHFWPQEEAVGKYMRVDQLGDWGQVVGVVADVAQRGLGKAPRPMIYVPYAQDTWPTLNLVIRTAMDPKSAASAASAAVHQVDRDEPVYSIRTMREVIASSVQVRRFRTVLLALFATLALVLAAIGIYGVVSYTVAQRSHEIGIRLALGAAPNRLRWFVVGEGLQLAVYGTLAGVVASLELTRFLSAVLYGVRSTDALTFLSAAVFLITTAFAASYVPARRAMKLDPANIFRA